MNIRSIVEANTVPVVQVAHLVNVLISQLSEHNYQYINDDD